MRLEFMIVMRARMQHVRIQYTMQGGYYFIALPTAFISKGQCVASGLVNVGVGELMLRWLLSIHQFDDGSVSTWLKQPGVHPVELIHAFGNA